MDSLTRDSNLLNYSDLSIKDLERQKHSILNPWMDATFIQSTDSGLEIIAKIALAIITLTGSLWVSAIHDHFHELSNTDIETLSSVSSELGSREEEEAYLNELKLDPTLVKRNFNQIDRKSLFAKLAPILGNDIFASMLSTQITNYKSYDEAINYLLTQAENFTPDEFDGIVNAIKSELYSEVK